jgi:hypothetical protein
MAEGSPLLAARSTQRLQFFARLLLAAMTAALIACSVAAAEGEAIYQEKSSGQTTAPPTQSNPTSGKNGEWLPACSPDIIIAAVFKKEHRVHVIGYVKRSMIGKRLRLQSHYASGATVLKFKSKSNGYFDVTTRRPHHRLARGASWRVVSGRAKTPWVKLYRPLVLNNVHQWRGTLMINGALNVPARGDTVVAVQRLDDCHHAMRIGQLGMPVDGGRVLDGGVQLRDLDKPVSTFVRLRVRVRNKSDGSWGKSFWSLPLPVVLKP